MAQTKTESGRMSLTEVKLIKTSQVGENESP
jgi:hypothetical protein